MTDLLFSNLKYLVLNKYVFTVLLLTTSFGLMAQPEIAWQRCYGTSQRDYFSDAIAIDDGFAAVAELSGTDGDMAGQDSLYYPATIMEFDIEGNLIWIKHFGDTIGGSGFIELMETKNSGYMIAGLSAATGGDFPGNHGQDDFILIEIDNDGNKLWSKSYGSPGTEFFGSFIQTDDGGYLVTGSSNSSGGDIPFHYEGDMGTTDAIVFKTDSVGNLLWLRNLGGSGYDGPAGDPVEVAAGQYIISITSTSNDFDLSSSGITGAKRWLIQMDSTGSIVKENFITPNDITNNDGSTTHLKQYFNPVGRGMAESVLFPSPAGHLEEEGAIAFFDTSDLELIDLFKWGGSEFDAFRKYCRDEHGNFYFLGYSKSMDYDLPGNYNNGDAFDYWILATDSNFQKLWSRNFGGSDDCGDLGCSNFDGNLIYKDNMLYCFIKSTTDVIPDHDIECGHPSGALSFGLTDAWLVAFDLSTSIHDLPEENELYHVYPNPSSGNFVITPQYPSLKQIQISLFDITGQNIYSDLSTETDQIFLNMEELPPGIYTIRISDDDALLFQTKIIIQ